MTALHFLAKIMDFFVRNGNSGQSDPFFAENTRRSTGFTENPIRQQYMLSSRLNTGFGHDMRMGAA